MFKRPLLFACSLAALSGLGLAGTANADILDSNGGEIQISGATSLPNILDYNVGTAPGLTDSFPQFNPQLGTLETVTLFGSVPWSETVMWTNNSSSLGLWNLALTPTFGGNVSNGDSFNAVGDTIMDSGAVGPNSQISVTEQPSFFDPFICDCFVLFQQEDSSSSFFQSYIGAGSLTLSGTEGSENVFANWSTNIGSPNITQDQNPYSLAVEYAYAPAVAPEPSFAFVIAAVLGLLVAVRFGRRAVSKPATDLT